jgi:hypothetical protein
MGSFLAIRFYSRPPNRGGIPTVGPKPRAKLSLHPAVSLLVIVAGVTPLDGAVIKSPGLMPYVITGGPVLNTITELPNAKGVFGVGEVSWNVIGGGTTAESAAPLTVRLDGITT